MSSAEHWEAAYRDRPRDQSSWWQPADALWMDLLDAAAAGPASTVIDVGGGSSLLVDALVARGSSRVTVLDLSTEALRDVRDRLGDRPDVDLVAGDVRTFRTDDPVDVWHDRAVLHFLTAEADRSAYRATLLDTLRVGGHAVIAGFGPDGPEQCSGLTVRRSSPDELTAFLGDGFEPVIAEPREHTTPRGVVQRFSVVVARRVS